MSNRLDDKDIEDFKDLVNELIIIDNKLARFIGLLRTTHNDYLIIKYPNDETDYVSIRVDGIWLHPLKNSNQSSNPIHRDYFVLENHLSKTCPPVESFRVYELS